MSSSLRPHPRSLDVQLFGGSTATTGLLVRSDFWLQDPSGTSVPRTNQVNLIKIYDHARDLILRKVKVQKTKSS